MEIWPNFFIVGAPKAGTTSLYEYFKGIPGIFMSPIKEPNYFSVGIIPNNYHIKPIRDKKKYLELFHNVNDEKIIGESSPGYLQDPKAPYLIHDVIPNAKILISLRDPVERLYSNFLMSKKQGWFKLSFHEEIKKGLNGDYDKRFPFLRLSAGKYSESINRYIEIFNKKQVKIIIFEQWIKNPKKIIDEVLEFLEVKHSLENFQKVQHNPFSVSRGTVAQYILRSQSIKKISGIIIPSKIKTVPRETEKGLCCTF